MEKVVFVVDDSDIYLIKSDSILRQDYEVVTISSGERMLDLAKKIAPDLILMDIEMPDMDGFEAAAHFRATGASAPIIFMSGTVDSGVLAQGARLGIENFIEKPFDDGELLERVRQALL